MPLKHNDIWRAVDALAAKHKLSPSGLARKAGLSPTAFNPTKRSANGRKRWLSTESIARILKATGSSLEDFTGLAAPEGKSNAAALPLARLDEAQQPGWFDEDGAPLLDKLGNGWESYRFTASSGCFAFEIGSDDYEPLYRDGDILVLAPKPAPRRGDRVALQTAEGAIHLGRLARQTAHKIELHSFATGEKPVTLPYTQISWIYRIIWASQ